MNNTQIERLAAMAHALRPDWPVSSLTTWLSVDHASKPYRDVATALAWVACDENTRTPKRMNESGPWWPADAGSPMRERPSDPSWPYCDIPGHPRIKPGTSCSRCERERLADDKGADESVHVVMLTDEQKARNAAWLARIKGGME